MRTTVFLLMQNVTREPEFGKGTVYLAGPRMWTQHGMYTFTGSPENVLELENALVSLRDGVFRLNGHRIAEQSGRTRIGFPDPTGEEIRAALDDPRSITIVKTPDVCGGRACFRNSRMPIWTLVQMRKQQFRSKAILASFPHLHEGHLLAAERYYESHSQEIDYDIADNAEENDG